MNPELTNVRGISIRACVVIGAICLERFCRNLAINMGSMKSLLEAYWAFAITEDLTKLDDWRVDLEGSGHFFWMESDEEMPSDLIERLNRLGQPIKADFTMILNAVGDIGMGCMYTATNDLPWASLVVTFAVLERYSIPLPDLEPFRISASTQSDPWGDPVASEIVQQWKQQFLERAT
jgi:hypothetical protein